jgi:transaldolase
MTLHTTPEGTLKAFADHGEVHTVLPGDGGDSDGIIAELATAGISVDALAAQLQDARAKSFVSSWNEWMAFIASKRTALNQTGAR